MLPGGVAGVQAEETPGAVSSASIRFPGFESAGPLCCCSGPYLGTLLWEEGKLG